LYVGENSCGNFDVSGTCVSADSVALSSSRQRFVSMCCGKGLLLLGGKEIYRAGNSYYHCCYNDVDRKL